MSDNISYTPEEVAKLLRINKFTVYEMIKRGELTGYRIGRKYRIDAMDLDAFFKKSKDKSMALQPQLVKNTECLVPLQSGLVICGQDIILDIIVRHLEKDFPATPFLRKYCGSTDGLTSLYRGMANVATAHLWDSDSDSYNTPYVRRLLPGNRTLIINLVYRMEGFFVAKGNPKNINDWPDLTKPGVELVNRECGSGARVLLDEKLRVHDIDYRNIAGYKHEELTHLAVASCVARGDADVGVGIEKVAMQMQGLDFIPLQKERYDLVIRKEDVDNPYFQAMLSILKSERFKNEISGIGGYDLTYLGKVVGET